MRSPYLPPETDLGRELVGRSRLRVMLASTISSIVVAPLLIFGLFHLAGTSIPDHASIAIAVVVIPLSLVVAVAATMFNKLPLYVAAALSAFTTFVSAMAIFIFIGVMNS